VQYFDSILSLLTGTLNDTFLAQLASWAIHLLCTKTVCRSVCLSVCDIKWCDKL